ncbi:ATP-binding cassette domain-containing protein [Paraclostridium bifermentans]|nr:ATP-binding cassette domain-containing protein [Paraclostridium bifermentans]
MGYRKYRIKRYKNTPINSLSGGERQRAYIAQALCQNPRYTFTR